MEYAPKNAKLKHVCLTEMTVDVPKLVQEGFSWISNVMKNVIGKDAYGIIITVQNYVEIGVSIAWKEMDIVMKHV